MLETKNGEVIQVRASGLGDLLKVVMNQFRLHCFLAKQEDYHPEEDIEFNQNPLLDIKSITIVAQTFSAFCVEAFYFDYYCIKESKTKAESWTHSHTPIEQFEELSKDYLKEENYKGSSLYKNLKGLYKTRIRWAHNKSTELGKYKKELNYLTANQCVQTLKELFKYFADRDSAYETSIYLYEVLHQLQIEIKAR